MRYINQTITAYVQYAGFEFEVEVGYTPFEPDTWDYPGCKEAWELERIYFKNENIIDILSEDARSDIFNAAVKNLKAYRDGCPDD